MSLNLWVIPLLPLLGAAINGLLGKKFSNKLVSAIALTSTAASFAWAATSAWRLYASGTLSYSESHGYWLRLSDFSVEYGFLLDHLSLVMMLVVTGVGFLIHIYATGYMAHEGGYYRFFSYLNLFMFFMLTLVLANNYLLMFVGWEGVGLASYLLIGFYFTKDSAANAGKKAFIVNRIGDFGFLIALFLLVKHFGTLQYAAVIEKVSHFPVETTAGLLTAIAVLMFVGATGKSAQIPLYVWLPDAMEGPTPVSALIHAATMVTAGVYMVCRSNAIFSRSPMALAVVAVVGCMTALFAATIGITQTDIKRVLAYSTVSQLGYMFLAAGVAAYSAAIFHLMTHAFFKALLFLGAGSVIHAVGGEQDMRKMGGLRKYIPYTFWTMLIATCAIAGIPGLAGFFSKDEILWQAFSSPHGHWVLWLVGITTAFITSFYMFRLVFMTFYGEYRGAAAEAAHGSHGHGHGTPHESPWVMLAPLVILAVLSAVGGYVGVPKAIASLFGVHNPTNHIEHFLAPAMPSLAAESAGVASEHPTEPPQEQTQSHEENGMELALTGVSVLVGIGGLGLAWLLYVKKPELPAKLAQSLGGLYTAVLNKYYIDEVYAAAVVRPIVSFSRSALWQGVDVGTIDRTVNASAEGAQEVSDNVREIFSGNIRSYAGWISAGAAAVVFYMVWVATR